MNIGSSIQLIRVKRGINQKDLACECNISQAALSQIENGIKSPGKKTLQSICSVLNISEALLYILCLEETDIPEENRLIYEQLFPEVKGMLLKIIESNQDA